MRLRRLAALARRPRGIDAGAQDLECCMVCAERALLRMQCRLRGCLVAVLQCDIMLCLRYIIAERGASFVPARKQEPAPVVAPAGRRAARYYSRLLCLKTRRFAARVGA